MNNETRNITPESCHVYGVDDYLRYVVKQMTVQETTAFVAHAQDCRCCLQGIRQSTLLEYHKKEQADNDLLYSNALSIMDRLDQSIFSVVISAVKGVVELIQSTGEQMFMEPALAGTRSSDDMSVRLQPLRIIKEFEESQFSIEVTISPVEPDMLDVIVSLLDRQLEEFTPGVAVSCHGENTVLYEITDENGQARFRIPVAGFYELVMKKDDHLLGTMTLTGL
ncbi:MAG: hypothetical protein PHI31_15385 [Desulfuromonadaceae bacterium]|nr:hypothetical protein [Desulfuromonadaceae bacterium]